MTAITCPHHRQLSNCAVCAPAAEVARILNVPVPYLSLHPDIRAICERIGAERAKLQELEQLLSSPHTADFDQAVPLEAAHAAQRWEEQDREKSPHDWYNVGAFLLTKARIAAEQGDTAKALHHCISTAALCRNWHRTLSRSTR